MSSEPTNMDAALATLSTQMSTALGAIAELRSDFRSDSDRNAKDLARLASALSDLRLQVNKDFATTAALSRVDESSQRRHDLAMAGLRDVDTRLGEVERSANESKGVTIGIKGMAAVLLGMVSATSGIAAVVVTSVH